MIELLQAGIDGGGVLHFKGNTDERIDTIKATPYGVGWFYNGDKITGASTLAILVERERVNLDAWIMTTWQPSQLPVPYTQLPLIERNTK